MAEHDELHTTGQEKVGISWSLETWIVTRLRKGTTYGYTAKHSLDNAMNNAMHQGLRRNLDHPDVVRGSCLNCLISPEFRPAIATCGSC